MQFLSLSHLAPYKNNPLIYAPYFAGDVIDPASLSNENYQINLSIGTLYFLEACCCKAVVNPVGNEKPEIQKIFGWPFATHCRS